MMINTMMFGSLVSMVTAQVLVWCLIGCFSYNSNREETPRARNIILQIVFTMVYAMT